MAFWLFQAFLCPHSVLLGGDLEHLLVLTGSPRGIAGMCRPAGVGAGSLSCLWLHASFCCGFAAGASLVTSSRTVHRGVPESSGKMCLSSQKGPFCSEDMLWGGEENIFLSKRTWTHSGAEYKVYSLCLRRNRLQGHCALPPGVLFLPEHPPPPTTVLSFCGVI